MSKLHPKAVYLFWWTYFWPFLFAFFFLFMFIGIFSAVSTGLEPQFTRTVLITNGIIGIVVAAVLSGIWARLMYNSYEFDSTPRSLNVKWGVIRKHSVSIPYHRIQSIDINRGIMARIVGLSEVWIQTAGFSMGISKYGALRFSEGIIPGLEKHEAEKLKSSILKRIKGRHGL